MSTDRELRAQIEEAEATLRASRQRLLEERATFPARTTALETERHALGKKLEGLQDRIARTKMELEKVNEDLGYAWSQGPALVDTDDKGRDLTIVDGLLNAIFGQTPDWAQGQPFTTRLLIRFQQGRGRR